MLENSIRVQKSNSTLEPLDLTKFRKSLEWSTKGIKGVSVSDIEMQCKLHFYDEIPTSYMLDVAIKTTYDMATVRHIGYDEVSRNLKLQKVYKQVYKSINPWTLKDQIIKKSNRYNGYINSYSDKDLEILNTEIDHSRDFTFSASGLNKTLSDCLKDKKTKKQIETPQFMYMLIAMDVFRFNIPRIIELYHALSTFYITISSPESRALRTKSTDYASCCTIRMGDNINSWHECDKAILKHTVASAGVGVDIADIASIGNMVKDGEISHSGKIKIIKSIDTHIGKASQNGRRGSATPFVNFYDPEIEDIFSLKSPRTAVEKRVNDLSYGIKVNQLVYDRAKRGETLTLFSVRQAPNINSAFYSKDINIFIEEYTRLEKEFPDNQKIDAREFFKIFGTERFETSAYYVINIDEINSNTSYTDEISQSNICVEFMTPTKELDPTLPDDPAIGICVLGNLNQTLVTIEKLPFYTKLMLEMQTTLALRQNHPTSQANAFVHFYRDVGIGFSNHAHWLASQGLRYGQPKALELLDEWMEHFAYGLISASCDLVDVFGAAPGFDKTNWASTMPIDRYKKTVDELVQRPYSLDWDSLRIRIQERKMANCGLSMVPPSENSSIGSNQISSVEPLKDLLTIKDKSGINLKQFAPDAIKLSDKYDYAFDRKITQDYLKHIIIIQKWLDKGISANAFYNPELYLDTKVLLSDIIDDIFFLKYFGGKTLYYNVPKIKDEDGKEVEIEDSSCSGGGCSV